MKIVYIHGASATSESFNYLRSKLGSGIDVNYDSRNGFENNLNDMLLQLKDSDNIVFVAHSLGGIYALHLANAMPEQVLGAVTLSTPYGGAEVAQYAQYFLPFSRLMRDIGPSSWTMRQADKIKIQHPWTNIVTVKGQSPFMLAANDGVVTISSQRHHADMELVEVDCNHYEVVLSDVVVELIQERLSTFQK
jgi:pimeloyl-ACP methyl ester carboxylesterase|tara:strand:+ start:25 stop:600 length:576 start_codon:yes stop_codon:yes gene_type:complete